MKLTELFTDASKWTKGVYARDALHKTVPPYSADAVCFCLMGAIGRCYPGGLFTAGTPRYDVAFKLAAEVGNIGRFNDDPETTFEDIKAIITKLDI